jgi:hypothetical protein
MATHSLKPNAEALDISRLGEFLLALDFTAAAKYMEEHFPREKFIRTLHELAEGKVGILAYTFATTQVLEQPKEAAFWHRIAASVVYEGVEHTNHAHHSALWHILQAIEAEPGNVGLKEYALNFFNEGILDEDFARRFAGDVLTHNKENALAQKVMQKLNA